MKNTVIFCSASKGIDPEFDQAARDVVRAACSHGYGIVSGGTIKGTMNVVANTAAECGAENIGVIPHFMEQYLNPNLTQVRFTETMAERKEGMREGTCLAIALPGGIGTLDELFETMTLAKLGRYDGRIIALNLKGFYEPLKALLDHLVATGMLDTQSRALISFPETVEELSSML